MPLNLCVALRESAGKYIEVDKLLNSDEMKTILTVSQRSCRDCLVFTKYFEKNTFYSIIHTLSLQKKMEALYVICYFKSELQI